MLKLRATPVTSLDDGPISFRLGSGSDWRNCREWAGLEAGQPPECSCKNVHIVSAASTIPLASFSNASSLPAPVSILLIDHDVALVLRTYFVVVFLLYL